MGSVQFMPNEKTKADRIFSITGKYFNELLFAWIAVFLLNCIVVSFWGCS